MSKVDCGKARMRAESLVAIVQLKECGLDLDNENRDKWKVWELFGDEGVSGGNGRARGSVMTSGFLWLEPTRYVVMAFIEMGILWQICVLGCGLW